MIKIQKLSFRIWLSEFICYLALDNWNFLVRNTRLVWAISLFARRYLGNNIRSLILRLMKCFTSAGSLSIP